MNCWFQIQNATWNLQTVDINKAQQSSQQVTDWTELSYYYCQLIVFAQTPNEHTWQDKHMTE